MSLRTFIYTSGLLLALLTATAQATCWRLAEDTYGIDLRLLRAIAQAESNFVADARNVNRNGTVDMGLMQINSVHFPRLKKLGVTETMLVENPCVSLMVGASILSEMIARYGYGWEAVGAYNAGLAQKNQGLRRQYASKISKIYRQNTGESPW